MAVSEAVEKGVGETQLDAAKVSAFKSGLRGALLDPSDATYDETRKLWNAMIDKRPALIVRATGVADVVASVNFARTNDLLLAIRGGGHNVAGLASCDGGVMLDLSQMKGVRVDPATRMVRVQGGATWGDVDRETQVFGLAVPGGVVSTTGVAGLTLGGGMGWQMRKRGFSIDNLVSVDIVTADGKVRIASEKENPDLFWAIRGGGGNFGVVTSFEFRAYPVGPTVYLRCPLYPMELAAKSLKAWRDFMREAPEEFGASFLYWSIPAIPWFPEAVHNKPVAIPLVIYVGDPVDGERLSKPLGELGAPLVDLSGPMPWTSVQAMFDPFVPKQGLNYYWKSIYLEGLDDKVVDETVKWAGTIPSKNTYTVILPLSGALSRVKADATAFGRRDIPYLLELDSMWPDPKDTDRNLAWTRKTWSDMQKHSNGGLYLNFPGLGEEGEHMVRSAVGSANYQRLVEIKNKYDPMNLFRVNLNIKPIAS